MNTSNRTGIVGWALIVSLLLAGSSSALAKRMYHRLYTTTVEFNLKSQRLNKSDVGFRYKVSVNGTIHQATIGRKSRVRVSSRHLKFFRIRIHYRRRIVDHWVSMQSGGTVHVINHPCCGIQVNNPAFYADRYALCKQTTAGQICRGNAKINESKCACAKDAMELSPGLALDKVCGRFGRCIKYPLVRVFNYGKKPVYYQDRYEDKSSGRKVILKRFFAAEEINVAQNYRFEIVSKPDTKTAGNRMLPVYTAFLTLAPGRRYNINVNEKGILAVWDVTDQR